MATKKTVYADVDGVWHETQAQAEHADRVSHATTILENACEATGKHWDLLYIQDIARKLVERGYYVGCMVQTGGEV